LARLVHIVRSSPLFLVSKNFSFELISLTFFKSALPYSISLQRENEDSSPASVPDEVDTPKSTVEQMIDEVNKTNEEIKELTEGRDHLVAVYDQHNREHANLQDDKDSDSDASMDGASQVAEEARQLAEDTELAACIEQKDVINGVEEKIDTLHNLVTELVNVLTPLL